MPLRLGPRGRAEYAELKNEKGAISSMILRNRPGTRYNPTLQKIAEAAKAGVIGVADDDVIEDFDFETPFFSSHLGVVVLGKDSPLGSEMRSNAGNPRTKTESKKVRAGGYSSWYEAQFSIVRGAS